MARTVQVTMNTRRFIRDMLRNDDMIKKRTSQLVDKFAMWMKLMTQHYCPNDEGRLSRSIRIYRKGRYEADVRTSVPYAVYVEYGTGIYASGGGGRRTPWMYKHKRWGWVRTRGQKPRFFFRKGFDSTIASAEQIVQGVFKWR